MDHTLEKVIAEWRRRAGKQVITGSLQVLTWKNAEGVKGTKEESEKMLIKVLKIRKRRQLTKGRERASGLETRNDICKGRETGRDTVSRWLQGTGYSPYSRIYELWPSLQYK